MAFLGGISCCGKRIWLHSEFWFRRYYRCGNVHWNPRPVTGLENDHRSNRFALVHQVETLVDFIKLEKMSDHRVNFDLAAHVPVDDLWNVPATPRATECGTSPYAACIEQLRRLGRNVPAGFGHSDRHRNPPAGM